MKHVGGEVVDEEEEGEEADKEGRGKGRESERAERVHGADVMHVQVHR